jgi:hypothetical protein
VSRAKHNRIDQFVSGARHAAWTALVLLLIAAPAQANRIVQVRVGNHPTFTRLVFEMDAFTGYQVARQMGADGSEQLTVTLEASTRSREITSKSVGIASVNIPESTDQAIAKIQLRKPGLQMKEMILSNPPRIVLDFVHSAAAVAELTGDPYAKPAPAEPKPVAKVVEPKPAPKPVAKVVEPKPAPKPVAKVVEPKAAPKPVAKVVEPKPEPETAIAKVVEPKPLPEMKPVSVPVEPTPPAAAMGTSDAVEESEGVASSIADEAERRAEALRDSIPGVHKREPAESRIDPSAETAPEKIADAADPTGGAPLGSASRVAKSATDDAKQRPPSPSDATRRADKPKPADSGMPFGALTLAGIAVAVLIVLVVAVRLFRRRSLPQDLDVTTLADAFDDDAAASDGAASDRIPAEGFAMSDSPTDEGSAEPQVEEQNTAAYSLNEVAANETEPVTGLYDEDSEGEKPMDMETTDLPTERENFSVPPAAAAMGGGDSDMSQLVQELASRIANLETRLDEANDSRERLERQVAAQSEELRVQRAAIARTQRALRGLSRSEEEQATEPALRD